MMDIIKKPEAKGNGRSVNEQSKDTKINPVFNELKPEKIQSHISELQNSISEKENPFPVNAFPPQIQEIIAATNESLNFPIDFIGASILYAFSVAIGNSVRAEIMKGYIQNAVLYLAIVGRPGSMKTHPLRWALKPIERRDNLNFDRYQREKREYDILMELSKKERKQAGYESEPLKPVWKQILIADFTQEALASVHLYNRRGLGVYVDELASWFKNFDRYNKGSQEQFWLDVWNGGSMKVNRKTTEPINVPLAFISVAGTIQPGVLNELAENRTENGFLDRLLFIVPDNLKKDYWNEKELDPFITDNWHTIVSRLLDFPINQDESGNPQPEILKFTPDARQLLFNWQRELTDLINNPKNEAVSGVYAKIEVYAIRLALCLEMMCFACGEGQKQAITIESVKGALALVEYFIKSAIKVHNILSNVNPLNKYPQDKQILFSALPDNFKTSEGIKIADGMDISERTFKHFLTHNDLFSNIKRGEYEKRF